MEEDKKKIAIELLEDFSKEAYVINQGKKQTVEGFDNERLDVLGIIKEVLDGFFNRAISLEEFKKKIDSINKKNPYWGFRGINGQMFFNMLYKSSNDKKQLTELLLDVLKVPTDIEKAKEKINKIIEFVKVNSNEVDKRKIPRIKSVLYFVSYFWQIQNPNKWPIFYNSLEQTLSELGFLESTEDLSEYYGLFYYLNFEILNLFKEKEENADLWFVEHVFWKYFIRKEEIAEEVEEKKPTIAKEKIESFLSFIPQIIGDIIPLSLNESGAAEFEKKTAILFTMLGFDVELLGQGKGRTTDIICRAVLQRPYLILVDCKARSNKDYKLDTQEERKGEDYIRNFPREYPRDRQTKMYYLIVSSGFRDDSEEARRRIKAITGTDVSFIKVEDLLYLLSQKLQNWYLDIERIEEVFGREGVITKDIIQDIIGR